MEWCLKAQVRYQLGDGTLQSWARIPQMAVCDLNQHPHFGAVSTRARSHGSRSQRAGMGVAPLILSHSDPLEKCLLPVSKTLCSTCLEVLLSKRGMFPLGNTIMIPVNWELILTYFLQAPNLWINRQKRELLCWLKWLILSKGNWTATPQWK